MVAKTMEPVIADITPSFDSQVKAVCISIEVPWRVFVGSEQGVLASDQDSDNWRERCWHRQDDYLWPMVASPTITRLIEMGVIPQPQYRPRAEWPRQATETASDRADTALKKTQALSQYVSGNVMDLVPPLEYLTKFLEMDLTDAQAIEKASGDWVSLEERQTLSLLPPPMPMVPGADGKPPKPGPLQDVQPTGRLAPPGARKLPGAKGNLPGKKKTPGKRAP